MKLLRYIHDLFRILIAIELIEEAALAVADIPSTLFFPLAPFLAQLVILAWFCICAVYLASAGEQFFRLRNDGSCPALEANEEIDCDKDDDGEPIVPNVNNISAVCPEAVCEFYRYGNPTEANWLQVSLFIPFVIKSDGL